MRIARIVFAILSMASSSFSGETLPHASASLFRAQVNTALRTAIHDRFGPAIEFEHSDVVVLANGTALGSTQINVERLNVDPRNGAIEVRLRCGDAACLPFYALVTPRQLPPLNQRKLTSNSLLQVPTSSGRAVTASAAPAVRAGSRTRLVISTPRIRISLPGVSLETRLVGESVRVRAIGNPRIFNAVVRGPGLAVAQEP